MGKIIEYFKSQGGYGRMKELKKVQHPRRLIKNLWYNKATKYCKRLDGRESI